MQKGLCIAALAIAAIVFILFFLDLVLGLVGQNALAPFGGASVVMDIVFVICSGALGAMSWFTFKEQA